MAAGCQTYPPTTFQVCGRIRDKYNQTGGSAGFLLFPKSNELTNPGNTGKRSEFVGGNIYWSAATDAHPVAHEFLTKWGEKGYEAGYMKYPTTDEIVLGDGTSRRQEFQGASIYFSFQPGVGTHVVQGNIRDYWRGLGAETSQLGFPISDELQIGDKYYSKFQGGTVYWSTVKGIEVAYNAANFLHEASGEPCDPAITTSGTCDINFDIDTVNGKLDRCIAGTGSLTEIVFGLVGSSKFPNPMPVTCGQYKHINDDHDIDEDRPHGLQCLGLTYSMGAQMPQNRVDQPQYRGIDWYNSKNLNKRSSIVYDSGATNTYGIQNALITAYAGTGDGNDWGGCAYGYMS